LKEYENTEKYNTGRESSVIRESLSDIKSSMMSLGQVNMAAMQECESLKERYDLLMSQLDDLQKGKDDLLTIINELNGKSQEMFEKTYVEIRKNFQMIFSKLFNGGKADILLTEPENLLETGIDVEVQPPGQTRKSITLLSGGQRTMTAIALMFATFMVKPSPFCLLDEIDAALDEANVTRFIELVQDFKDQSQFVMITHNKKTMSAANVMYGVTQETMGVSKIVSAKFIEKNL
jgi:chromosome segregation protein